MISGSARSKLRHTRTGKIRGGSRFVPGALTYILQNRLYLGEIYHRRTSYKGLHESIVDEDLFNAVNDRIRHNLELARRPTERARLCPLTGLIFDANGNPMVPAYDYRDHAIAYRYYVSDAAKNGTRATLIRRVQANGIENLIVDRCRRLLSLREAPRVSEILPILAGIHLRDESIHIVFQPGVGLESGEAREQTVSRLERRFTIGDTLYLDGESLGLRCGLRAVFHGGRTRREDASPTCDNPHRSTLIALLKRAFKERTLLGAIPGREQISRHITLRRRRLLAVSLIAPDIQKAILGGIIPSSLRPEMLMSPELPSDWRAQRQFLGFDCSN